MVKPLRSRGAPQLCYRSATLKARFLRRVCEGRDDADDGRCSLEDCNVGIAIINHLFLMVYTTHLW